MSYCKLGGLGGWVGGWEDLPKLTYGWVGEVGGGGGGVSGWVGCSRMVLKRRLVGSREAAEKGWVGGWVGGWEDLPEWY